jgi:hypothetical protein
MRLNLIGLAGRGHQLSFFICSFGRRSREFCFGWGPSAGAHVQKPANENLGLNWNPSNIFFESFLRAGAG